MKSFDADSGRYQLLYSGALESGFMALCDFADVSANGGSEWPSSVGIVLSSEEHKQTDAPADSLLKLATFQKDSMTGWQYFLTIRETGESETRSSAVQNESAQPQGFTFALVSENAALYTIGDDVSNTTAVDLSRLDLAYWTIVVSGAKGEAICVFNSG